MSLPLHPALRLACALGCALALWCGDPLRAASFAENRDFATAMEAFRGGQWGYAEIRFAQFVADHPKSERMAEAVLYQARAQFEQRRFGQAIALLTVNLNNAGQVADRYHYWIGEAQFAKNDYAAAANEFGRVARDFPTSPRRLAAAVGEADARARLNEWSRVIELLQKPDGPFQQSANTNASTETVARGRLLLAEAGLAQRDFSIAESALQPLAAQTLKPELDWQRRHLLCRVQLGTGRTNDALTTSRELVTAAGATGRQDLLAESISLNANILERLGRLDDAVAAFERNLEPQTPAEHQRQALLKIAALAMARNRTGDAIQRIQKYLESTNAPATDATAVARLTLGELYLKERATFSDPNRPAVSAPGPAVTNLVRLALTNFDEVIAGFTNDLFVGNAYLGRGWCYWLWSLTDQISENLENLQASAEAFNNAVERLPLSYDQAVAHFKLADVLFRRNELVPAISNYNAVVMAGMVMPKVKTNLCEPALYQIVRAGTEITNTAADTALEHLLKEFPDSYVTQAGLLFSGQGRARQGDPTGARRAFEDFLHRFPNSTNAAQARLEVGRTYELQHDWTNALREYQGWLSAFPTNAARPRAEFALALASYHSGDETNSLNLFTNFIAQLATNALAPQAQWWVADYYFRHGDYVAAEKNYKLLFQQWPTADLAYQARLMAGQAALSSQLDFRGAIDHFTNLTSNPNCPPDVWRDAMFAYGGTLMLRNKGETNDPAADLRLAIGVFGKIQQKFANTEYAAQALGEIGNCNLQLGGLVDASYYTNAVQAYQQVMKSERASVATRSLAQIGLGATLEARARTVVSGEEKKSLLKQALANYLDVLYGQNLRENEIRDPSCIKRAGLEAVRITEATQEWPQTENLYRTLGELIPPLKESMERRIQNMREQVSTAEK